VHVGIKDLNCLGPAGNIEEVVIQSGHYLNSTQIGALQAMFVE
jgi:hypothetical protein